MIIKIYGVSPLTIVGVFAVIVSVIQLTSLYLMKEWKKKEGLPTLQKKDTEEKDDEDDEEPDKIDFLEDDTCPICENDIESDTIEITDDKAVWECDICDP